MHLCQFCLEIRPELENIAAQIDQLCLLLHKMLCLPFLVVRKFSPAETHRTFDLKVSQPYNPEHQQKWNKSIVFRAHKPMEYLLAQESNLQG